MTNVTNAPSAPVFVVGMNGSGTTMMLDHLGQHPTLYAFRAETRVLPFFLRSEGKYGDLNHDSNFLRLWHDMRNSFAFRRANAGKAPDLPSDWTSTGRSVAQIFDRIMCDFAHREGKTRWSEKTPMHVLHIAKLAQCFPQSRILHMLRDGRDCAASDHRRWGRHPAGTIYRWKRVVEEGSRQGRLIGDTRYLELRYEDVTESPEHYMRRVCEFLGLEFDDRVLSFSRPRLRRPDRASQPIVQSRRNNRAYFSESCLRSLEQIAGLRLVQLGYRTHFVHGDKTPSRIVRGWWVLHDFSSVLARQLRMKMTVQKRMTWSLFFARLRMIVRSQRNSWRGR